MKQLLLFSLFILLAIGSFAQPNKKGERIESLKIAHISGKLNLDPQTAERFWPVYNQYENELSQVVMERRRMNQNDTRSAEDILDQEQKALDIKRKYSTQFQRIIGPDQMNTLYSAEKEFRQMLMRKARRSDNEQSRQDNGNLNRSPRTEMRGNEQPMQRRATPPRDGRTDQPSNRGRDESPMRSNRTERPNR